MKNQENQNIGEMNEKHEAKEKQEKTIISNELKEIYEQNRQLFEYIKNSKGIIFIKNKLKNFNIKISNESFYKIYKNASLSVDNLSNYIVNTIVNETTVEIASSTELYDDNNEKIYQIMQSRNVFTIILAKDMKLEDDKKRKKQIYLKSKSIKNILSKIDSIYDTITYIQITLTHISTDYDSTKILTQNIVNRFKYLLDAKKMFYIVNKTLKKKYGENEEKSLFTKYPISYYSIKKIMNYSEKDDNQKEQYLTISLLDEEDIEKKEQENNIYKKKLTKASENCEINRKFKENEEKNIKNILDKKIDNQRMKKVLNDDIEQSLNVYEKIVNNKRENKREDEKNYNNINNKYDDDISKIMKDKKTEIGEAINDRYNRFIEIMHNNKDKKYINLQYLDLMEDFNKKYSKFKIDYYLVKNDRFKDVLIPVEYIRNYMRYKNEYEKKQFVLINLNDKENEVQYLVNLKILKKLYDQWTDLKKIQVIDTENPQFEGKAIDLSKASVVKIGQIKELPQQPDLIKKIKENIDDEESLKIYEQNAELYKNVKNKDFIIVRRVIKKRKKIEKNK